MAQNGEERVRVGAHEAPAAHGYIVEGLIRDLFPAEGRSGFNVVEQLRQRLRFMTACARRADMRWRLQAGFVDDRSRLCPAAHCARRIEADGNGPLLREQRELARRRHSDYHIDAAARGLEPMLGQRRLEILRLVEGDHAAGRDEPRMPAASAVDTTPVIGKLKLGTRQPMCLPGATLGRRVRWLLSDDSSNFTWRPASR